MALSLLHFLSFLSAPLSSLSALIPFHCIWTAFGPLPCENKAMTPDVQWRPKLKMQYGVYLFNTMSDASGALTMTNSYWRIPCIYKPGRTAGENYTNSTETDALVAFKRMVVTLAGCGSLATTTCHTYRLQLWAEPAPPRKAWRRRFTLRLYATPPCGGRH